MNAAKNICCPQQFANSSPIGHILIQQSTSGAWNHTTTLQAFAHVLKMTRLKYFMRAHLCQKYKLRQEHESESYILSKLEKFDFGSTHDASVACYTFLQKWKQRSKLKRHGEENTLFTTVVTAAWQWCQQQQKYLFDQCDCNPHQDHWDIATMKTDNMRQPTKVNLENRSRCRTRWSCSCTSAAHFNESKHHPQHSSPWLPSLIDCSNGRTLEPMKSMETCQWRETVHWPTGINHIPINPWSSGDQSDRGRASLIFGTKMCPQAHITYLPHLLQIKLAHHRHTRETVPRWLLALSHLWRLYFWRLLCGVWRIRFWKRVSV